MKDLSFIKELWGFSRLRYFILTNNKSSLFFDEQRQKLASTQVGTQSLKCQKGWESRFSVCEGYYSNCYIDCLAN